MGPIMRISSRLRCSRGSAAVAALLVLGGVAFGVVPAAPSFASTGPVSRHSAKSTPHRATSAKAKAISVSLITDLTGEDAPARKPFNEGVISYFRAHPKIGKARVTVHTYNGQDNPAIAPAVFRQAVASHPAGIIDFAISTSTQAAEPILASSGTACLCIAGPDSWYGPNPYPWAFAADPTIGEDAHAYMLAAKKLLGGSLAGKRIAISGDNTALLALIASEFEGYAKQQGATIVGTQFGDTTETSWSGEAANIAAAKPNLVLEDTIGSAEIVQIKSLETAGLTHTPIVAFPGLSYSDIAALNLRNLYETSSVPYGTPRTSVVYKAAKKYGFLADETSFEFELGWMQAAVLGHALTLCGPNCPGNKLEAKLTNMSGFLVPGDAAFGRVGFTRTRHAVNFSQGFITWDAAKKTMKNTLITKS